jgi:hypothetical protein
MNSGANSQRPIWNRNCSAVCVAVELVLARVAACCVHPNAAWDRLPPSGRTVLVAAYVGASYLVVLAALVVASIARAS